MYWLLIFSMNFLLTIAIPTYNRFPKLKVGLDSIFNNLPSGVEVIVCDNSSDDDTSKLCNEYQGKYESFRYIRHAKNNGYDYNVISCVKNASGKYIWFLSDDDFIDRALIDGVLIAISKFKPNGLLVNAKVIEPESEKVLISNLAKCTKNQLLHCDNETLKNHVRWSTLISSQIILRDSISIDTLYKYIGTCFVQIPMFWNANHDKEIYLLSEQMIIKNDSKEHNFEVHDSQIWLVNWINVIDSLKEKFDKKSLKVAAISLYADGVLHPGSIIAHTLMARLGGLVSLKDYSKLYSKVHVGITKKVLIFVILLLNKTFLSKIFLMARAVRNSTQRL